MNKTKSKIWFAAGALIITILTGSCCDVLEEYPRSIYDPGFFKTEEGIEGGLTSLYSHLRRIYGNGYWLNICETGTDEYTYGSSADQNFKVADLSGQGSLDSESSRSDVLWQNVFTYINTASGIIENATEAGISPAKIAEAHFFRAFDYFQLVRTFGGVPLDFGSGVLKFNATPSRTSARDTVPCVYTKAIFPDLIKAINDLPDEPRTIGSVTKTVARKYLSEAYLTYAWWLQNPGNKPTYPECQRVDPDSLDASDYFQMAYDVAIEAIKNHPTSYGLVPTFSDLTRYENDRNIEILLYADHTSESAQYNGMSESGSTWDYAPGESPDNFAGWMCNWNYGTMEILPVGGKAINPVQREAIQPLGRPWIRMAPTIDAINNFTDKDMDSRYDATFTTVYHGNWHYGANPDITAVTGSDGKPITQGGVVLRFLDEEPETAVVYPVKNRDDVTKVGAGKLSGYSEYVISPSAISRYRYPALFKLGMSPSQTMSPEGKRQLGAPNGPSARPFNIAKFSEFYLLAAEAAVKGATTQEGYSARELVNVLRARAGKWNCRVNGTSQYMEEYSADFSKELTEKTPQTITIDYILDERMREYFGEGYRWFDLTRTQLWQEKAGTYRICGNKPLDNTPQTIERTIPDGYYLRPIPQATIDAFEMADKERIEYQNPAYITEQDQSL